MSPDSEIGNLNATILRLGDDAIREYTLQNNLAAQPILGHGSRTRRRHPVGIQLTWRRCGSPLVIQGDGEDGRVDQGDITTHVAVIITLKSVGKPIDRVGVDGL